MNGQIELENEVAEITSDFKCEQCAAKLTYKVGTQVLGCGYCGHENKIPQKLEDIQELDFKAYLANHNNEIELQDVAVIKCQSCGAESSYDGKMVSHNCPFCDSPIVSQSNTTRLIKPKALLPFRVDKQTAQESFRTWIKSLWFAPNALKARVRVDAAMNGVYLPHWTFDASTMSYYTGMRGIYYYVTETQMVTNSEGKSEKKQVKVRKTRWYPASGTVMRDFDDVLVAASKTMPMKYIQRLEPWDLNALQPYQDEFLTGFKAESYQVDLPTGFSLAKIRMDEQIQVDIRNQIGGDEQMITTVRTSHNQVSFKHILLPVWLNAYRYNDKVYRFVVNARTGEVQGERPWSWIKISLVVLVALILIIIVTQIKN